MIRSTLGPLAVALCAGVAAGGDVYNIELDGPDFVYNGQTNMDIDLAINTGDTVVWTWVSGFHNVVWGMPGDGDAGALFDSGDPTGTAGTTLEFTFNDVGVYSYHCEVHAGVGMMSQIRVVPAPGATALLAPAAVLMTRRCRR